MTSTKKNTKSKKVSKPVFNVDLTGINTPEDIYLAFYDAKVNSGVAVEKFESMTFATDVARSMICSIAMLVGIVDRMFTPVKPKKKSFFKKIWDKIF